MKRFARLFAELDASTATNAKLAALQRYVERAQKQCGAEHPLLIDRYLRGVEIEVVCAPTVELRPLLHRRRIDLALRPMSSMDRAYHRI